ncbi:tyrosine-type recombinase/integrase [Rhodococcoides kyotonense]|uniref:Site-specific recombinase XerD n=1 Tax=Rhodococcoides kyotonense TaxID=398843 RepID=A0A239FL56_9NOCA|nr:tyrosine-type recombinase/integrase [Rhodococcus kyotonensis]SNS57338.1 Site-specific recombinase XerD [Rhodococcus kyotonensis]
MNYKPAGVAKALTEEWSDLLSGYISHERAAGRPWTSISTRRAHVSRMSRELNVPPAEVTGLMLKDWFGLQDQWKTETRRGYRNSMRAFFGWACSESRIDSNPALDLPHVSAEKGRAKPAPDRVWKESQLAADDRTLVMLELACHVGMRRAEVAVCSTDDLHEEFDGWMLTVHGKGGKDREVPVTDEIATMIQRGAAGHTIGARKTGYLFPGDIDGHLSPRWVGKLCAQAMPGVWTMHKLRHRYATRALRGTNNLRAVQELLGHASVATTEIYTDVGGEERRAAAVAAVYRDVA